MGWESPMSNEDLLIIYGTTWCGDCRRARSLLDRFQVPYRWVDVDRDVEAARLVEKLNRGFRSVPTLVWPDGTMLVEPSNAELLKKLESVK